MKKTLAALAVLSTLSTAAVAETFNVNVDVDVTLGEVFLELTQTQGMAIPQVSIDEATVVGADCHSYANSKGYDGANANNRNSLCPNLTGQNAEFSFVGVPNALITVSRTTPQQEEAGIRFTGTESTNSYRLSSGGVYNTAMSGTVTLIDKSAVTDGLLTFTYNIEAAYQ